jgi:hypothetical protein
MDYTSVFKEIFRRQPLGCEIGTTTLHPDDMDRVICLCSMAHMGMALSEFLPRRFTADELKARMEVEMAGGIENLKMEGIGNRLNSNIDNRHMPNERLNSGQDKVFSGREPTEDLDYEDMSLAFETGHSR